MFYDAVPRSTKHLEALLHTMCPTDPEKRPSGHQLFLHEMGRSVVVRHVERIVHCGHLMVDLVQQ